MFENRLCSEEEEMGPEQLAAYRAELAQYVHDHEEAIRGEQDSRRERVRKLKGHSANFCRQFKEPFNQTELNKKDTLL